MGALSLTARKKYRDDYHPFLTGVKHVNFNSVIELEQNTNHKTAGVFVECIQGEGGVNVISNEFANKLNELKEKYGFLLVADEIQSGVGRTGKLHSFEHFGLEPDVVIVAKGIGGGLPLGAVLGNDVVAGAFSFGTHGSTFGGNPVACACGLVVFERLENGLMDNAAKQGELLKSGLTDLKNKYPDKVRDVRGLGLMLGIEVKQSAADSLVQRLMRNDVLVNCTNGNVIRLLPPLIIGKNEADFFLEKLDSALSVPD
jgi:acetylornithine aminotransferase